MSAETATIEEANAARESILSILVVVVATTVLILVAYSWIESRRVPAITILGTPQTEIAIDVRGAVSTPGVVYLPPGARLIDVVNATGGLSSDADSSLVNLSTRVVDGQMVVIPTQIPNSPDQSTIALININSANIEDLKELPGIGDVLAQRIVFYREFNGPYQSIDDLENVEGISASLIESIRPHITISGND